LSSTAVGRVYWCPTAVCGSPLPLTLRMPRGYCRRMDVILVTGFWLTARTWDPVLPALRAAGHQPHPLTLPGLESPDSDRSGITLADHVNAVVAAIDGCAGKVALVGHSGGGVVAYDALDARVDRVDRVVYVDTWPLSDGMPINDSMPVVGSDVPFPGWNAFEDV